MKKLITTLFCSFLGGALFAQWAPTTFAGGTDKTSHIRSYYKLDLNKIRQQLKDAQETGKNAKPVEISLPTLDGRIEKFAVYSFPVMAKDLADQYQLGSYVGVGIDDPSKYLRFSVAPNDFQSMIIKNGAYEFIEPVDANKTTYGVHPKTNKGNGDFTCSTTESKVSKDEMKKLYEMGKSFTNQPTNFAKNSDKKYRTMRLAMSVTGEYTQYFGGTVAGALTAINATMTRVNGVFEKDFALHLNMQNYPAIIYTNPSTDPYSPASQMGNWNLQLQQTLTTNVGDANYDIGHLFGASGGGGNAGCIGCVCIAPTTADPEGKGSGYTSPADAIPQGDNFDIDYVAHEMGHQLGANHTFSQNIEGTGVNMEPGSGSTIMGYAGIVPGANVQMHSDAYFHVASIEQVQTNLMSKTCDVETTITNNPPVIGALSNYTIPKGTAFVLTGTATDPENDPMTYTWEEYDSATSPVTTVTGNNTTGALFRSWTPTATGNTRYFPKLSSVLAGNLTVPADWETVSNVARPTNFKLTVRDNNPVTTSQQTQSGLVTVTVSNDGPFKVNTPNAPHTVPATIQWTVANTAAAPYNAANVKVDYTTDNGTTWTVLSASTPNDGTENFTFPAALSGQTIKLRISSIGNVFYAVKPIAIYTMTPCDGSAPTGVTTSNITQNTVDVNWMLVSGATYIIRYKKLTDTTWQQTTSTTNSITLSGLEDSTTYEVQVAAVCSGTPGAYSASSNFTTQGMAYCTLASVDSNYEYISNVTLANVNNNSMASTYTNYTTDPTKVVNLVKNSTNNVVSVSKSWVSTLYDEAVRVWIDFNKNGTFDASELVMDSPLSKTTPVTATFTVPSTAVVNKVLRMRVAMSDSASPPTCGTFQYGEVEDYNVMISDVLATNDLNGPKNDIQLYPNPVSDILNVTKVSDKAAYKIYSAAGQLVESGTINGGKINVSALIKGGYVITIEDKGRDLFKSKFIKK
ncbi:Por secretion system C-terminal sorting domain-containing protein [Chryseobacterium wanjuense]|uniref:Por secretion system C-terminal sorting domain-containing protein n=1 Tax=Chryseobacterium wanjuense TaxID=356305 RepID=A0A1I0S4R2_9FLAO|nr:zinc-dependent metalloprotease family protein [Chryseobacterium wanjuense]SEW49004.1 Por secretion system C-terminal sorting domain-containing protein [Chryseobacterium wanjuense]